MLYVFLLVMTVMGSGGAFFLKKASSSNGIMELLKNLNLYLGGGLYFFSALINVFLLRYLDYSIVLPLTSFTYIWTLFLSGLFLKEVISRKKIIGSFCVVLGAVMVVL